MGGGFAGAAPGGLDERTTTTTATPSTPTPTITTTTDEPRGQKVRAMLRARLGEDIYTSWFNALEFESFDGRTVRSSVPVKFLRNWIQSHYSDDLLACCAAEFKGAERVEVSLRQPGSAVGRTPEAEHGRRLPSAADGARMAREPMPATRGADRRRPGRRAGPHQRRRLRGLAARSALHLRQLRRRPVQPHGACRRDPGRRDGAGRAAAASIRSTSIRRSASARRICCTPSPGR